MTQNELFCPYSLLHRSPMPEIFSCFAHSFSTAAFASGIFNAWGIGMNLWPRLWWVKEFIPFAVMWSWWCLCPAPSSLGLVYSSASTTQACFVMRFPILRWVSPLLFIGILQGIAAGIGTDNFLRAAFIVSLNSLSFGSMKNIPLNCLAFSSFGISIAHLCFALFFAASDINFHISGHTSSGREVVCFLVSPWTRGILLVAFLFVERILWILSMSLTIPFLHARSSNLQYSSPTIHPGMCMSFWFGTQNSWSGFSVQLKTMHRVHPKLSELQMSEISIFPFDRLECIVHLPSLSCMTIASSFTEAFWAYSGEVSIFCNSPSSRSESAMLSTESSKCICDWMHNVSNNLESGTPAVPNFANSSVSSGIGAWWSSSPNLSCTSSYWYGSP